MNSLINFHAYLLLNVMVLFTFIIMRWVISAFLFKADVSQLQRLKFVRYSFMMAVISFLIIPVILLMKSSSYTSHFRLEPILKNVSTRFLEHHVTVNQQLVQVKTMSNAFQIEHICMGIMLVGIIFFLANYIKNIVVLNKLIQESFCRHKLHNVFILFNSKVETSFCWSFLNKYYVVIPNGYLLKKEDLKIAVSHELQHIRQGDTHWAHFFSIMQSVCFWNPFLKAWRKWVDELQEFTCDEAVIIRKKTTTLDYAKCLMDSGITMLKANSLPHVALGINGPSKSLLYKRIEKIFEYKQSRTKKYSLIVGYIASLVISASTACAFSNHPSFKPLTIAEVNSIIEQSNFDQSLQITATKEVVDEINNIRSSQQARDYINDSLKRMQQYQPLIKQSLTKNHMPYELLALPLVESGYQPLAEIKNPMRAAGIWQIVPSTGKRLGLVINSKQDDRFDMNRATAAAISYLTQNQSRFHNWKLAVIAYEIGELNTGELIKTTRSTNAWVLAKSKQSTESLKKFVTLFDAAVILMNNPKLLAS